jgi:hypothetical protein
LQYLLFLRNACYFIKKSLLKMLTEKKKSDSESDALIRKYTDMHHSTKRQRKDRARKTGAAFSLPKKLERVQ